LADVEKKDVKDTSTKERMTLVLTIVVVGLLLFSAVQALELNSMRKSLSTGNVASGSPAPQQQQVARPAASAPSMVGGC